MKINNKYMKILWVNPSFLDYRIPVYKKLFDLSSGNFYILFSQNRVPERIPLKIKDAIGNNAICFEGEKRIILGKNEGLSNKWASIPFTRGLYKEIEKINPDIVIAEGFFQWTPKALKFSLLHKKPLLIAYERTKHTERDCPKWRTFYRKLIDKFCSGYLCNGILTKDYLEFLGFNKEKIFIGGMSADSKGLSQDTMSFNIKEQKLLKEQLKLDSGITYIYAGQLIERKGVIYLLKAWEKHILSHNMDNLLIVGGGDLYNDFIKTFGSVKNIFFTNSIDYSEIYKFYAISDVFIIPTLEDNWSLVVPEAMACGLPIACSIYNGCYPELVHEGVNGKLFDPLKEETILETLDYFHNQDLKAFGNASKEIEKDNNSDVVGENVFNVCKKFYKK